MQDLSNLAAAIVNGRKSQGTDRSAGSYEPCCVPLKYPNTDEPCQTLSYTYKVQFMRTRTEHSSQNNPCSKHLGLIWQHGNILTGYSSILRGFWTR